MVEQSKCLEEEKYKKVEKPRQKARLTEPSGVWLESSETEADTGVTRHQGSRSQGCSLPLAF